MLSLDGDDGFGNWVGGGKLSPFAVHDDAKQDWVFVSRFRWLCALYIWWHK